MGDLLVNGISSVVKILVKEHIPMAIALNEKFSFLVAFYSVRIPRRSELVIPNSQIAPLLLTQIPNDFLAFHHHQIVTKRVVMRRLHTPRLEPHKSQRWGFSLNLHRPTWNHINWIQFLALLLQTTNCAVIHRRKCLPNLGHLHQRIIEKRMNFTRIICKTNDK